MIGILMSEQNAPVTGRRARKKARTREALRAAARQLFAEQGFAATTVEQIADVADVSERTFFRYFRSKEELLLPDLAPLFDAAERELRARPLDEHPLDSFAAAVAAAVGVQKPGGAAALASDADLADPVVAARLSDALVQWEERLTELFAARLRDRDPGDDPDAAAMRAAVIAGVGVGATRAAVRVIRARAVPAAERLAVVRGAFAVARAGCGCDAALVP